MLSPRSTSSSFLGFGNSALIVVPSILYAGCNPPDSSSDLLLPQMLRKALNLASLFFTFFASLYRESSCEIMIVSWEFLGMHTQSCNFLFQPASIFGKSKRNFRTLVSSNMNRNIWPFLGFWCLKKVACMTSVDLLEEDLPRESCQYSWKTQRPCSARAVSNLVYCNMLWKLKRP